MNNFDQYEKIEQEILKHTPRELAKRIIGLEEQLKEAKADIKKLKAESSFRSYGYPPEGEEV